MKKIKFSWIFLIILLSLTFAYAEEFPNYKDKYVNDFAGIFSQQQVNDLKNLLISVEQNTTAEIAIVSIETCLPYAPSQYSNLLFNKWSIGKKEKDNGLLILYCKQENKIQVETGYGLEGILPDSKLGRLLDENYVPLRDSGKVQEGIILFAEEVTKVVQENKEEVIAGRSQSNFQFWIFLILIILIILLFISFKFDKKNSKKGSKIRAKNRWVFLGGGIGGFGRGGFGGSGGFGGGGFGGGFGGGGSGGGGAGR